MKHRLHLAYVALLFSTLLGSACGGDSPSGPAANTSASSSQNSKITSATTSASGTTPSASSVASAVASGVSAAAANEIKFTFGAQKVGAAWERTSTREMEVALIKPKADQHQNQRKSSYKVTVLAADDKVINKLKVTYAEVVFAEKEGGKEKKNETLAVANKTYIVEFKDKKLNVLDDKERPAQPKEADIVKADFEGVLGRVDPIVNALPDVALKRGDKVDSLAEAVKEPFKALLQDTGVRLSSIAVTLKEIRTDGDQKVGSFELKFKVESKSITVDVSGVLDIRASDSRISRLAINGPITFKSPAEGKGNIRVDEAAKY